MFIKKGDKVVVITGKDKGKVGTVIEAQPKKDRVVVEGVNIIKKHVKNSQDAPQGGIVEKEAAIHVSNVMLQDPEYVSKQKMVRKYVSQQNQEKKYNNS